MGTVGSVTVAVKADSTQLRADMVKNQALVKQFAQTAQAAGQTASQGLQAAASGGVILSEGLGSATVAATGLATAMGMVKAALLAAFPIAGAFAMLEVLEKIADNKFAQAATNIGDGFRSMNVAAETSIDTLKLSTAKMQEQIDLLSGKRPNTLAEDLANASLAADKLASSLDADNRKIKELLEQQRVGAVAGMFTNRAGTADVEGSINSFDADIAHLSFIYQRAVRMQSPDADKDLGALDAKRRDAAKWQSDQLEQRSRLQAEGVGPNQDANVKALTGFGDVLTDQSDMEADEKQNKATASKLKGMEDDKRYKAEQDAAARKALEAQNKARTELLKSDEEQLKAENAFNKLTINETIQFWNDRIAAFTKGSDQFRAVQEKMETLISSRPDLTKENKKNQANVGRSQVEGNDLLANASAALLKIQVEQIERADKATKEYNSEVAKGAQAQEKAATVFAESSIQIALAQGAISKLDAAQALAAIHEHDHAAAIDIVNQKLAEQIRLIDAIPDREMSPEDKENARRNLTEAAANQTSAIDNSYSIAGARDQQAVASQQIGPSIQEALNTMVENFNDMAATLKNVIPRTIDGLNNDLVKLATGQYKKGDVGRTLLGAGGTLLKTGLQGAEGAALGFLTHGKLGAKRDGSSEMAALWVQVAKGQAAIASLPLGSPARTAGLAGAVPGGSFIQPFIGGQPGQHGGASGGAGIFGQLLHAFLPGIKMGGGAGAGGPVDYDGFFQGGFASGGDVLANRPAMVGELGPELFVPRTAGSIVPNGQLGGSGGHTFNIDARGSNDPAAVHAAVMRAAPHIAAAGVQATHQNRMRTPGGR